jgi:2,3-bisphosphoglycerate-dependent phosphoglycerate mutase
MLNILLVRHGQTDANASGVLQGHLPTSLNDVGRQQAAQLAARLAGVVPPIEAVICSDLPRAQETAAPIARALCLEPECDEAWRERGFGTFEGQAIGEVEIWRAASGAIEPPGAETIQDFQRRTHMALTGVAARHVDCRAVAVVTHGGVMRAVLHLLRDGRLPLVDGYEPPEVVPIVNASILHLSVQRDARVGPRWILRAVNDAAHLQVPTPDFDAG